MNDETITRFTPPKAASAEGGGAWLCVIEGDARGVQVAVRDADITIGRRPDNDLVLPSPAISKYHAKVVRSGGHVCLQDLGSTNGSTVNQVKLEAEQKRPLYHGDILTIGDHTLIFRHEAANFADKTGMSTISFDMSKVREEADRLLGDWMKPS